MLKRKEDIMITDSVICAVLEIIDRFTTPEEKCAGETILEMLSDFNEDEWESMNDEERNKWISQYTEDSCIL